MTGHQRLEGIFDQRVLLCCLTGSRFRASRARVNVRTNSILSRGLGSAVSGPPQSGLRAPEPRSVRKPRTTSCLRPSTVRAPTGGNLGAELVRVVESDGSSGPCNAWYHGQERSLVGVVHRQWPWIALPIFASAQRMLKRAHRFQLSF